MKDTDYEISKLKYYLEKSIEISQNIHIYWQLGSIDEKKKIQEIVFPEGIVIDTHQRTYLTSKINSLFHAKSQFNRDSEVSKKRLPIKNDEESSVVDKTIEISNLGLIKDIVRISNLVNG